jgi:hypothetical protein
MRDDNWRSDPPIPRAVPKPPSTPAKDYSRPSVMKVAVAVKADSEEFMPTACDASGACDIVANIPSGEIRMNEGSTSVIDCGFSIEIPPGYRCSVSSSISGLILEMVEAQRFKVNAINLGQATILRDRDVIGRIWIEPVHFFEWITKG